MLEKLNNIVGKFKDVIEKTINFSLEKATTNKSIFYYVIPIIFILGLVFFVNSKLLFSKEGAIIRSTPLNEMQISSSLKAKILSRKYNPITKTVEFIIYTEDSNNIEQKPLKFELREQQNPNMLIPTRYQKIDNNYYVVLSKVKKNWEVLSLSFGYENSEVNPIPSEDLEDIDVSNFDTYSNDKNSLVSVIRIYSDSDDIETHTFLTEHKRSKYISEITDLEVGFINEDIEKLNKKIDEDTSKIKDAENKILELKSDKKYQTESEQNATEASITKLKNLISSTQNLGEDRVKKVKELKDKITKLEQKKRDYGA
ncbi:hypothetical protein [Paeniclostridium hominis]|uniref:hypothetical protein n=1 Tax=Paeniclostridium hominis TaxID=2764329 RepID=UPI0022E8BAA9|nr:hypothetical protein [Paeniclostridium hominis]